MSLTIDEVPPWLQFNKFILTGYRPQLSVLGCLRTLFTWHNESINVWSHLVPAMCLIYLNWHSPHEAIFFRLAMLSFLFIFSASSCYHLLMPCCRSADGYRHLICTDVMGALLSITMSAYTFILHGYKCTDPMIVAVIATCFGCYAVFLGYIIMFSTMTVAQRFALFGTQCIFRVLLAVYLLRPKYIATGYHQSYYYHMVSFVVLVIGGLFNISRVPERWFPEWRILDCLMNSHNIWHYFCVLTTVMTMIGAFYDQLEYDVTECPTS